MGSCRFPYPPSTSAAASRNILTFLWGPLLPTPGPYGHNTQSVSSVTQSCLTLCDPKDCNTPGFPVHHQLLEFTEAHVHWISDAIQPPHRVVPFSSHLQSFPASGSFSNESVLHIRWPEYWSFSFNISPSNDLRLANYIFHHIPKD